MSYDWVMDAFATWLRLCDWVAGFATEGMMTDDFPSFDWYDAYEWGMSPQRAVQAAILTA